MVQRCLFALTIVICLASSMYAQDEDQIVMTNLTPITLENIDKLDRLTFRKIDIEVVRLLWSSDSKKLLITSYEGIWILDLASMEINKLDINSADPFTVGFINNSGQIIYSTDGEIMIYDIDTSESQIAMDVGKYVSSFSNNGVFATTVQLKSDAKDDAIVAEYIRVYDVQKQTLLFEIPVTLYDEFCDFACPVGIAFSPDNSQLVFTAQVSNVESGFVDLQTGVKKSMPPLGHTGVVYSQDGSLIATLAFNPGYIPTALLLIDTQTAEILTQIDWVISSVPDFNSTSDLIAIGIYDTNAPNPDEATGYLYLLDVQRAIVNNEYDPVAQISFSDPPGLVAFSPNNQLLAVYYYGQLSLFGVSGKLTD